MIYSIIPILLIYDEIKIPYLKYVSTKLHIRKNQDSKRRRNLVNQCKHWFLIDRLIGFVNLVKQIPVNLIFRGFFLARHAHSCSRGPS